jgi:hypothetical protein
LAIGFYFGVIREYPMVTLQLFIGPWQFLLQRATWLDTTSFEGRN